ncbi:hypothetical protein BDA96_01G182100 [Sorghum bicolor]|uniref:Uncharacterized protein n=2 Tax=Sorghum bicolor TaxID=4558 RepID=A0A921UXL4_SORBI|nr:hypothetical protein BDA96_01G182100 [Sorghum bicolor]KXG38063.1 hypothetical protein SORBI_3001G174000 [Sorghum bicolor]
MSAISSVLTVDSPNSKREQTEIERRRKCFTCAGPGLLLVIIQPRPPRRGERENEVTCGELAIPIPKRISTCRQDEGLRALSGRQTSATGGGCSGAVRQNARPALNTTAH